MKRLTIKETHSRRQLTRFRKRPKHNQVLVKMSEREFDDLHKMANAQGMTAASLVRWWINNLAAVVV